MQKNKLVFPFQSGNGDNGSNFYLFMSEVVCPGDVIRIQKESLHVKSFQIIDEGDFFEDFKIATVQCISPNQYSKFELENFQDIEITTLWSPYANKKLLK